MAHHLQPQLTDAEHKAWTALDLAVEKARARCEVAFQYAGRAADKEAKDGLVQIDRTHLQSFCFMVFETFDALKEAADCANAFYAQSVALREDV